MKIILTQDVLKIGNKYDVKEFSDGYAQNVLIAKGLAIRATQAELAKLEIRKKNLLKKQDEENKAFEELISQLGGKTITLKVKANEKGHLFQAVRKDEVIKIIKEITSVELDEENIIFPKPIKEIGSHSITIKKGERSGVCTIHIA